jgi:low affinity Fe/Cu permease
MRVKPTILVGIERGRSRLAALNERFRQFAHKAAAATGSPLGFTLGVLTVLVWAVTGPLFGYSEAWQLVINTGTTIVTFLMVFILQNTQMRDSREIHVKLDELLRALESARNDIIRCQDLSDEQLSELETRLRAAASRDATSLEVPSRLEIVERP